MEDLINAKNLFSTSSSNYVNCGNYDPYADCPGYCADYCSNDEYCPSLECDD